MVLDGFNDSFTFPMTMFFLGIKVHSKPLVSSGMPVKYLISVVTPHPFPVNQTPFSLSTRVPDNSWNTSKVFKRSTNCFMTEA